MISSLVSSGSTARALFVAAAVVCLVAQAAIVVSAVRISRRSEAPPDTPKPDGARPLPTPKRAVEIFWAVVPAVALAVLLAFTWRAIGRGAVNAAEHDSAVAAGVLSPSPR